MQPINREDWLTRASVYITDWYVQNGFDAEYVKASCGWPLGHAYKVQGEIWMPDSNFDRQFYVHVSPILSDSITVLGVLAHEVAHTIDLKEHHRGVFLRAVRAIGLIGPAIDSLVGPKFELFANKVIDELGQYPFRGILVKWRKVRQRKEQARI